jgi:hypothetical protein
VNILYFNTGKNETGNDLLKILESHVPGKHIQVCMDIHSFSKQLIQLQQRNTIAVILTFDEEDLMELYTAKHLLYKVAPILILPDEERDTIALGFRCQPFFMTSIHRDLTKIGYIVHILMAQSYQHGSYDDSENHKRAA